MMEKLKNLIRLLQLWVIDKNSFRAIWHVRRSKLTYLELNALIDLLECVRNMEQRNGEGIIVEAGCALGGSALVIATAKSNERPLYLFDAFEMIPPPSDLDGEDAHERYGQIVSGDAAGIKGGMYYGYQEDLLESVTNEFLNSGFSLTEDHLHFVKGYYQESLHINLPVALAHLDCDWYDSVKICLERVVPNLVSGGVIIVDDYDAWSGCRKAVDEFFWGRENEFEFVKKSRLHIIRR